MGGDPSQVEIALRDLARRYADACDRRSSEDFVGVFTADAVLHVVRPGQAAVRLVGHAELAAVPERLRRWSATIHDVRGARYTIAGPDAASGAVDCRAHHLTHTPTGTEDHVMDIRYVDEYRREGGRWAIAHRRVEVQRETTGPFGA